MNNIDQLKEYDKLHYETGTSPLTDTEYDILKTKSRKENPYDPYFNQVGYEIKTTYKTIKLPFVMGGLDKVDVDTVEDWSRKENDLIVASEKLDGNSILCTWENGKLIFAASRGDEEKGQDILEKAIYFIPEIPDKGKVTLRGEVVFENDLYKYFGFKNRRNGIAGLLRRDDIRANDLKLLSVIFYEVVECPHTIYSNSYGFKYINTLNLRIPRWFIIANNQPKLAESLSEMLITYKSEASYDIDGLVLAFDESERENVNFPKNKVKFKVNEDAINCKSLDMEWNVTRLGYIKPVILIEPTEIMGVTVSRVSGFNYEFIKNSMIGKNAIIGVVRSGDVVPYVTEVVEESKDEDMIIPINCPSCGTKLEIISKDLVCNNPDCYYKNVQDVAHFFISMGVDGMSDKTIENIGITTVFQMYGLTKEYLENLPGFGEKKAEKIINEVKKTLKTKPEKLLAAFGIPLIGRTHSRKLCKKYTIDELFRIEDPDELGLGDITSKTFIDNIGKYRKLYDFMKSIGLEFEKDNIEKSLKDILFALTGSGPMKREEIQKIIESKGGDVKSVNKDTNYLVTNNPSSTSGKMKIAIKNNIPIINYEELFDKFLS